MYFFTHRNATRSKFLFSRPPNRGSSFKHTIDETEVTNAFGTYLAAGEETVRCKASQQSTH